MRFFPMIVSAALVSACTVPVSGVLPTLQPGAASQAVDNKAPADYDPALIFLPATPRQAMQMIVTVTGKPLGYTSAAQETAYIDSVSMGTPIAQYDPEGYLAKLDLPGVKASGRDDDAFVHAVRLTDYKPDTEIGGKSIWLQDKYFEKLLNDRPAFDKAKNTLGVAMDALAMKRKDWTRPLKDAQKPKPTGETPQQRYADALKGLPNTDRWHGDFHGGVPGQHNHDAGAGYGTFAIAKAMGFTVKQATRFGEMCNGVDYGKTPYGSTSPQPFGALDRHFNFNRTGQDTRLIYARKHLERAVSFGRIAAFNEAEIELGVGLHSLQDLFAHAQSSTSVHATMGGFLDEPEYSPLGMVEATVATRHFLKAYLTGITSTTGN